jgi:hypothetical protein
MLSDTISIVTSLILDDEFARIEAIRRDLAGVADRADVLSDEATRHFVATDLLVRDILLKAVSTVWSVTAAELRDARRNRTLPRLIDLAESHAAQLLSRELLERVRSDYHRLRNACEHDGAHVSVAKAYEYLEAVEEIAYSLAEPSEVGVPPSVLTGLDGYRLLGTQRLTKGVGGYPWEVVHGAKDLNYGAHHILEFWRYDGKDWQQVERYEIGEAIVATTQKVETRSAVQEELLVWHRSGESMGVMSYGLFELGASGIIRLLSRHGVSGAYVLARGRVLEEHAGDRIIRYEWDGEAYVAHLVVRHEPAALSVIDVHYAAINGKIHGVDEVTLHVGEKMRLLRDDFEPIVVRILYSANGTIEPTSGCYEAMQPGETEISLVPAVYDWERSLKITVKVTAE